MTLGGNGEIGRTHVVIVIKKGKKIETDPVSTSLEDGKGVFRGFREDSGCLVQRGICRGINGI